MIKELLGLVGLDARALCAEAIGDFFDDRGLGADELEGMAGRGEPLADLALAIIPPDAARRVPTWALREMVAWTEDDYAAILHRLGKTHGAAADVLRRHWAYYVDQMRAAREHLAGILQDRRRG